MTRDNIVFTMESNQASLERKLAKQQRMLESTQRKLREVAAAGRDAKQQTEAMAAATTKAGGASERAFGAGAIGQLKSFAGGFLGIGAAVGSITSVFGTLNSRAEAAARQIDSVSGSIKALAQISADQVDIQTKIQMGQRIGSEFGFPEADAQRFIFDLLSMGAKIDEIPDFAQLRLVEDDVSGFALGLQKLRNLFPGTFAGRPFDAQAGMLLSGAQVSEVGVAQFGQAVLGPSTIAKDLELSVPEILGATALATGVTKSPELAATRLEALFSALQKVDIKALSEGQEARFTGRSLPNIVTELKDLSVVERSRILTEKEALQGFATLADRVTDLREVIGNIEGEGLTPRRLDQVLAIVRETPETAAKAAADRAEARLVPTRKMAGLEEKAREIIITEAMTIAEERNVGAGVSWGLEKQLEFMSWLQADPDTLIGTAAHRLGGLRPESREAVAERLVLAIQDLHRAILKMDSDSAPRPRPPGSLDPREDR